MKNIFVILITSVLIAFTVFIHRQNESNENAEMERFAKIIVDETDEDFEKKITEIIGQIKNDKNFNLWVDGCNLPSDDSLLSYLDSKFFNNFDLFRLYNRTLIVCDSITDILYYDMTADCEAFYSGILSESKIINENLYHYDNATSDIYYITKIRLNDTENLYMEFYKEKIFNKFQIDDDSTKINNLIIPDLRNYSIAIYNNDILHYKFGNYLYPNNINNFIAKKDGIHKGKDYKHLILNDLENDKTVVITIESVRWMKYATPFSFIFIVVLLSCFVYSYFNDGHGFFKRSFHGKMQLMILLILAFSFFAIGFVSYLFLRNNVNKKTQIAQYKQANIIRNSYEKKLSEKDFDDYKMICDLSDSFFCSINIYDKEGFLMISSLETSVSGDTIDENALSNIIDEDAGYFVQTEYYKGEKNTSYYFPILYENNELAAILNVLYFDFNSEYDDQLSNFVWNYINIIIVLFGISSIIVFLITRKTLKPLKIIEEQMGKISLDGNNEPIDFDGHDEIGALVEQYNNMCRQLKIAANKIVRNERETAWREMARQVAHEIKNPLTPMRLNIEYMQLLWDRKDPKFEENFKETLKSLLEQTETLSKIATAFSDYAKFPDNTPTTFDIVELVKSTIKLYDVEKNITFSLIYNDKDEMSMFADKNNLGRVFGNLIKNSIQAIGNKSGNIEISIENCRHYFRIRIADNGCGIKEEYKKKVFFPNFTTKSSGMGVGLSVAHDIIQGMGGEIKFQSDERIGTVFIIDIPILKEM